MRCYADIAGKFPTSWASAGSLSALLLLGSVTGAQAQTAQSNAQSGENLNTQYNHCLIYSAASCPGMNVGKDAITGAERGAASMPVWSGRAGKAPAAVAVDLNNICRWIDNAPGNTTTDVFVPFRTDEEWNAFVTAAQTAGSGASQFVSVEPCVRAGTVQIPPNDPGPGVCGCGPSDPGDMQCYDQNGNLQTVPASYQVPAYGRVGEVRMASPGISFQCYTKDGSGPWAKTVASVELLGEDADRAGGSSSNPANPDWQVRQVWYNGNPPQPVNGACGTANNQSLSSAPTGSTLCTTGTPTAVNGNGSSGNPWQWICQGSSDSPQCKANKTIPACPVANVKGGITFLDIPNNASTMAYPGLTGTVIIPVLNNCHIQTSDNITFQVTVWGKTEYGSAPPGDYLYDFPVFYDFALCSATEYARQNLSGYANCTPSSVTYNASSPLKVNLSNGDAKMNSDTPTSFYLTLQDGRILEGHVKGGLNADEGWLMVRRSAAPLMYDNGALNADDWFGDRDHRSLNGYTDLAETFAAFLQKNEYGERFIPLHAMSDKEKAEKVAQASASKDYKITDPSFDLRIIDANNKELFASDYFDRILVEYRNVVEGDGPDGKGGDNIILERGIAHTVQGENHGAIDQWFILDIPADYSDPGHPTQSRVWPAKESRQ